MSAAADTMEPIMEMNTTPLIDVMLVLLIMLIITIPLQTHAVTIDIPTGPAVLKPDPIKNKVVIDEQGGILWNGQPTGLATLARTLETTKALAVPPELHLQPEALAPYARVDEVLAVIKRAQVEKMGFVGNERYRNF